MKEFDDDTEIIYSTKPVEPCWPFWGLLETVQKNATSPPTPFHDRIIFSSPTPDIFGRFSLLARESLGMLKHRDIADLRHAAGEINTGIADYINESIAEETECRVQTLYRDGGWELNYLPNAPWQEEVEHAGYHLQRTITEDEIRDLLANWSSDWDDQPSLPGQEDFDELTALKDCLGYEWFEKSELIHFGLIEPEEHEFFAVFALMIICEAVHSNPRIKIKHYWPEPTLSQIKAIGSASINAVEAMAYAERLQREQKIRKSLALEQPEILKKELSRRTSEKAVNAANIRHAANNMARDWVCKEWKQHRESYSGNKSDFSRTYVTRVVNEFINSKGEPLKVTEKTIREVWLSDTPSAGK